MAICTKGIGIVRNLLHHIDDAMEKVIEETTLITGKIKAFEQTPLAADIVALIPGGSTYEAWFNKAIDELVGVEDTAKSVADKIVAWLDGLATTPAKNAGVFKLASLAVKAADANPSPDKTESFYDSAVQLHVMTNKDA